MSSHWRPLWKQMLDEGGAQWEERNTRECFEWCTSFFSPSAGIWWMRRRWKRKMSLHASYCSPHQSPFDPRSGGPDLRLDQNRLVSVSVSTPQSLVSINGPLHAPDMADEMCSPDRSCWSRSDSIFTQYIPRPQKHLQPDFTVCCICLTCCCVMMEDR